MTYRNAAFQYWRGFVVCGSPLFRQFERGVGLTGRAVVADTPPRVRGCGIFTSAGYAWVRSILSGPNRPESGTIPVCTLFWIDLQLRAYVRSRGKRALQAPLTHRDYGRIFGVLGGPGINGD